MELNTPLLQDGEFAARPNVWRKRLLGLATLMLTSVLTLTNTDIWMPFHRLTPRVMSAASASESHPPSSQEQSRKSVLPFMTGAGPPGVLQAVAPPDRPTQVFLYKDSFSAKLDSWEKAEPAWLEKAEPAWLYGAQLADTFEGKVAVPTGEVGDVIEGRLFSINIEDKVSDFIKRAQLRKGVVSVVKADGSVSNAFWFFRLAPPRSQTEEAASAAPASRSWNPFKRQQQNVAADAKPSSQPTAAAEL
eukprot:g73422.t1